MPPGAPPEVLASSSQVRSQTSEVDAASTGERQGLTPQLERPKRKGFSFSFDMTPHPASGPTAEIRALTSTPLLYSTGVNTIPPQILSLILGRGPGPFSGQRSEWAAWRRQFLQFLDEIQEVMPAISGKQVMTIARQILDSGSVAILDAELLKNPTLEFSHFWTKLELEMGVEDTDELREKWYALRLKHQGDLKLQEWRKFFAEFCRLMVLIEATEDEAKPLLMQALPTEYRRMVLLEEDKKAQDQLVLCLFVLF